MSDSPTLSDDFDGDERNVWIASGLLPPGEETDRSPVVDKKAWPLSPRVQALCNASMAALTRWFGEVRYGRDVHNPPTLVCHPDDYPDQPDGLPVQVWGYPLRAGDVERGTVEVVQD